jgi:predicted nucleic acid-binding protein
MDRGFGKAKRKSFLMLFVDTSVWIDFLRAENTKEVAFLEQCLEEETIVFTGMVLQELLQGIGSASKRKLVEESFNPFVEIFPSRSTYKLAADLFRKSRENGHQIRSSIDCLFAACCIEQDAVILEDDKDYKYIAEVSPLQRIIV